MRKNLSILVGAAALSSITVLSLFIFTAQETESPSQKPEEETRETTKLKEPKKVISEPIANAKSRATKKPFGIYITPQTSPVQPEKFTGYHTGTDFETTSEEANIDIPIYAICTGKIRTKEIVTGYGGIIVQECTIENQPVTVLYGHLNIRQAQVLGVGAEVKSGERIGSLAPAGSDLSGGERKHLHLGIHKSTNIDLHGYVQNQSEL